MSKGFTLIEVLICAILFSSCMLGALSCQLYARALVISATERLHAAAIVADVLATLQTVPAVAFEEVQNFSSLPAELPSCDAPGQCDPTAFMQSQLAQPLQQLFSGSPVLADAELCIRAGGAMPAVQISWRSRDQARFAARDLLCPLGQGRLHLAVQAGN